MTRGDRVEMMREMLDAVANRVCKIGVTVCLTLNGWGVLLSLQIGRRNVLYIDLGLLFIVVIYITPCCTHLAD